MAGVPSAKVLLFWLFQFYFEYADDAFYVFNNVFMKGQRWSFSWRKVLNVFEIARSSTSQAIIICSGVLFSLYCTRSERKNITQLFVDQGAQIKAKNSLLYCVHVDLFRGCIDVQGNTVNVLEKLF